MQLLLVALGGGAGALARYLLGGWVQRWAGAGFPWGTLTVNLVGCLVAGFVIRWLGGMAEATQMRALVAVGFLGAFTTFSTFGVETVALLQRGEWLRGTVYVLASVGFGLLGAWVGMSGR